MRGIALAIVMLATSAGADAPQIVPREAWGAQPPIVRRDPPIQTQATGPDRVAAENTMPKREPARYLTVHHTARRASSDPLPRSLQRFQAQMFDYRIDYGDGMTKRILLGDLPYHYFIDAAGTVGEGRALAYAAYSNTRYASPIARHITVVLDGNFQISEPTPAQINALTSLLDALSAEHGIALEHIGGHGDVAQTLCPGKHLAAALPQIVETIRLGRE